MTPGIGGKTITRIFTRNDLLGRKNDEFLRFGPEVLREEYGLTRKAAESWCGEREALLEEAETMEERLDPLGVRLVTAADASYPRQVEALEKDPPGLLYLHGNARLLEADTFCVMSSRKSSNEALEQIDKLAEEGVLAGKTLVAGDDTPEYQRAAVVPLRWGAPRIIVLDRGLFKALGPDLKEETFRSARLWRYQFDPNTDLAISFTHPDAGFHRNANRLRDQLVGALSLKLTFVEITPKGNMEKLAIRAMRAGRPIRVSELSDCAEQMARTGAEVVQVG